MLRLIWDTTSPSLPARGAWIEIADFNGLERKVRSLPARGAWIEIIVIDAVNRNTGSLPARGAWIEIRKYAIA